VIKDTIRAIVGIVGRERAHELVDVLASALTAQELIAIGEMLDREERDAERSTPS